MEMGARGGAGQREQKAEKNKAQRIMCPQQDTEKLQPCKIRIQHSAEMA